VYRPGLILDADGTALCAVATAGGVCDMARVASVHRMPERSEDEQRYEARRVGEDFE
jgi:hypothetical protein